jgi:outer membrane receptor protein involved in Fe transport
MRKRNWGKSVSKKIVIRSATILALASGASQAQTVDTSSTTLEEVVVTSQRRSESIQQIPLSVTAITEQTLQNFGVQNFEDYAKAAPNLAFGMGGSPSGGPAYGVSSTREIVIRGVSGANTTSLYIDDTPIPSVIDPRVLDIERIEVLRGPQGTLFGASSMGGTVRMITHNPELDSVSGRVSVQGFDINSGGAGMDLSGTLNVPLGSSSTALRLSGFYHYDPGYFHRIYGVPVIPGIPFQPGQQVQGSTKFGQTTQYGGSASILFKPEGIPGLELTPLVIFQKSYTDGYPVAENDPSNFTQVRPLNVAEGTGDEWQFYALTLKYAAPFGDLVSSTNYLHRYATDKEDGTEWFAVFQSYYYSPLPYIATTVPQSYNTKQLTQELRLQSHLGHAVDLVTGLFFQKQDISYNYSFFTPGADALSGGALGSDNAYQDINGSAQKQYAGFIDATFRPADNWELAAGVRKASVTNSGAQTIIQYPVLQSNTYYTFNQHELPTTPRFVAKYSFDPNNLVYASASKGFRIGGSNSPATGACGPDALALGLPEGKPIEYRSDTLWSYELGSKTMWDERRIAVRNAIYDIEWKDIQQTLVYPTCGVGVQLNAGAARIQGAETEILARLTDAFSLTVSGGYEDGKITSATTLASGSVLGFPVGSPLSNVPKWTASARAEFTKPTPLGAAFVRAEYNFVGRSLSLANGGTGFYRDEYSLVDLRMGINKDAWSFTLFAKNLFNRAANFGDIVTAVGVVPGQERLVAEPPRTVGFQIDRQFGGER